MITKQFYYLAFMLFMIFCVLTFIASYVPGIYKQLTKVDDESQGGGSRDPATESASSAQSN